MVVAEERKGYFLLIMFKTHEMVVSLCLKTSYMSWGLIVEVTTSKQPHIVVVVVVDRNK